jgi:hypothetical protein
MRYIRRAGFAFLLSLIVFGPAHAQKNPKRVFGACGSSNGGSSTSAPTTNLCSAGTATAVIGSGPWTWNCVGSKGGTTATCSAQLASPSPLPPVNGQCGPANGVAVNTAPTTNLCTAGTASAVSGSGPWNWTCAGSNGGSTAVCWAPSSSAVNGACGSSNGASLKSAPTGNLCSAGTASGVSGSGPWTWTCAGTAGGTTASCQALAARGNQPVLIQYVGSSANPAFGGYPGTADNNFKQSLPNPTQAGDALVLGVSYPHGQTATITDSAGDTWPAAACTADAGSGNEIAAVYVLPNIPAGVTWFKISLTSGGFPVQYKIAEISNIAASSPVNGVKCTPSIAPNASAVINPGSFTPTTNNDQNGGDVIFTYVAEAASVSTNNPSSWVAASGFTPVDTDIAWRQQNGFPSAVQMMTQLMQGSVDPTMTATGDTQDRFNSVSVAMKVGQSGGSLPRGIYIRKINHETNGTFTVNNTWKLQFPATGNLRAILGTGDVANITGVHDSEGNTWISPDSNNQIWYSFSSTPNDPNLTISIGFSGTPPSMSFRLLDVMNATAFDGAGQNSIGCTGVSTITNSPNIVPTTAPGLVIAAVSLGQGPGRAVTSPSGATFDLVTYSNQTDISNMDNSDGTAHVYNSSTAAENWTWTITPQGNNGCTSEAAAFH